MLNCTCRFLVDHLTGTSGSGDMEKEGSFAKGCDVCFLFQTRITARMPESCATDIPHNLLNFAYPFWPNNLGDPLPIPLNHSPQLLSLQSSSSCFFLIPHIHLGSEFHISSWCTADCPSPLTQKTIYSST